MKSQKESASATQYFVAYISAVAALGGLLFGFDTAIISGAIPYIKPYFGLDDLALGWSVGSLLIGCTIGAAMAGKLADRYGRRAIMFICAALFAISGIGAGLSYNIESFITYRMLGGIGVGAAAMICPMYIAEMAPAAHRGRLVSFYQLAIVSGILLAYCTNYLLDGIGENNWRWMFASQVLPAVLFALLLLVVPDSPRWLVSRGRKSAALKVLNRVYEPKEAAAQLSAIEASFEGQTKVKVYEVFAKKYRPVLIVGILIAVFQQITGINAILYYAPVIFSNTGLDTSSSLLQTIGIGVVNVLATFIAIGLVDKVGRKKFLLWGSLIMGLSLVAVSLCFHYNYFGYYLVLIFTLIYVAAFGCTLGAVTWVYLSEIFPNRIRAIALSVATLALWLADFLITYLFPIMASGLGTSLTLLVYASCCGLSFLFVLFRVPETKGRSLEKIESSFFK